ncbi:hypothetical protein BJX61DRAFT_133968 [Aspergillus egyptiacus]|nr:hypothetical protein BJX61DRAFT_133968 [Aspergillus egyptiacus]
MHLTTTILPLLPLLPGLASAVNTHYAKRYYDDLCPSKDGQQVKLTVDLYATYQCGYEPTGQRIAEKNAQNPRDCAIFCSNTPECEGSMWVGQKTANGRFCYHYASTEGGSSSRRTVFITTQTEAEKSAKDHGTEGIFPDDDEDGDASCQEYKDRIEELEAELEERTENCKVEQCPFDDHSLVRAGWDKFKVYCKKLDDYGGANVGVLPNKTPQECIEACSETSGCTRAIWPTTLHSKKKGTCWLRDYTRVGPVPTLDSGSFNSAHLQE